MRSKWVFILPVCVSACLLAGCRDKSETQDKASPGQQSASAPAPATTAAKLVEDSPPRVSSSGLLEKTQNWFGIADAKTRKKYFWKLTILGDEGLPYLISLLDDRSFSNNAKTGVVLHARYNCQAVIRHGLDSRNPKVRREVLLILRNTARKEHLHLYLKMLKHSDADVQAMGVEIAVRLRDPRATAPLLEHLPNLTGKLRNYVIQGLGRLGDARVVKVLIALKDDGSEAFRLSLVQALGDLKDPAGVPRLFELMQVAAPAVKLAAARSLAKLGDLRALPILAEDVRSGKSRDDSIRALSALGGAEIVGPIKDVLADKQAAEKSRQLALRALGESGDKQVIGLLLKYVNDVDMSKSLRLSAAKGLAQFGQPAVGPLIKLLKSSNAEKRRVASAGLIAVGPPAKAALLKVLDHLRSDVRKDAIWVIGFIEDPEVLTILRQKAKSDRNHICRVHAVAGLFRTGGPDDIRFALEASRYVPRITLWDDWVVGYLVNIKPQHLDVLLEHVLKSSSNRKNVALALVRIRDPRSVPALHAVVKLDERNTSGLAIEALGCIGLPAVKSLIELSEQGVKVRRAFEIMRQYRHDYAPLLAPLLKSNNSQLRALARGALGPHRTWNPLTYDEYIYWLLATRDWKRLKEESSQVDVEALVEWNYRNSTTDRQIELIKTLAKASFDPEIRLQRMSKLAVDRKWNELAKIGPQAVDVMLPNLGFNYPGQHRLILALGKLPDERVIRKLLELLNWESSPYKSEAILALLEINDAKALDQMARIIQDKDIYLDEGVRKALLDRKDPLFFKVLISRVRAGRRGDATIAALAEIAKKDPKPLRELLAIEDYRHREVALEVEMLVLDSEALPLLAGQLGRRGWWDSEGLLARTVAAYGQKAIPHLAAVLEKQQEKPSVPVAIALAELGDRRAVPGLIRGLGDMLTGKTCVQMLGKLKDPRAIGPLLKQFSYGGVSDEARAALTRIGPAGLPKIADWVNEKAGLDERGRPHHDRAETEAEARKIAVAMGPAAVGELANLVLSNSRAVSSWARRCIVDIAGSDPQPVVQLIGDNRPGIREAAYLILAGLQLKKLPPGAEQGLNDAEYPVRAAAAVLLKRNNYQPAGAKLKARYLVALGQWDKAVETGEDAVEPLRRAFAEIQVSAEAGRALAQLGPGGKAIVTEGLKDKRWYVRRSAVGALSGGKGKNTARLLVPMLEDKDSDVRAEAAVALIKLRWKPAT